MRFLEIEQTGSPIRRERSQRETLIGLGLNMIGRISYVPDTPSSRGMIRKVSHLVRITNDPSAPKPTAPPPAIDEAADIALLNALAFEPNGIAAETYDDDDRNKGKTPDFKLIKDGTLAGYCELKSPRDDYIFETPPPGQAAIRKNVPFYRKIGSFIKRGAMQLDAVNPNRAYPNVLVFVSHAPEIDRRDLIATIAGLPFEGGGRVFMLSRKMQQQVIDAARRIDLFLWIDARDGTMTHLTADDARHRAAALEMFGLPQEQSEPRPN